MLTYTCILTSPTCITCGPIYKFSDGYTHIYTSKNSHMNIFTTHIYSHIFSRTYTCTLCTFIISMLIICGINTDIQSSTHMFMIPHIHADIHRRSATDTCEQTPVNTSERANPAPQNLVSSNIKNSQDMPTRKPACFLQKISAGLKCPGCVRYVPCTATYFLPQTKQQQTKQNLEEHVR